MDLKCPSSPQKRHFPGATSLADHIAASEGNVVAVENIAVVSIAAVDFA